MTRSQQLFMDSLRYIPGGVNSPVRAFGAVGDDPVFIKRGQGAWLTDEDDRRYIDYVGSWGPMILGHAHPKVIAAVQETAANGLSFGAPTELEARMAERVAQIVPSIEKVRMVSSGTEATMSAIRLARGFTHRDKIIKFEGCYHGHADSLLVKAGSGALTFGVPTSPGVPAVLAEQTITLTYNDLEQVERVFDDIGHEIAAVIVEPVAGNMNCVLPVPGFLQGLRDLTRQTASLLIFDEVMTGFRVALGGAQSVYGVTPDLTTLGKVIGGGMPVGAFGGPGEIMEGLAPGGPVYQAGTLSGNPVAMAAGLATLDLITEPDFYPRLSATAAKLTDGICAIAATHGIAMTANRLGGMFGLFFSNEETITNFSQVMACDQDQFKAFFHGMLQAGVYLAPSAFEAGFVSSAHGDDEIDQTLAIAGQVLSDMAGNR